MVAALQVGLVGPFCDEGSTVGLPDFSAGGVMAGCLVSAVSKGKIGDWLEPELIAWINLEQAGLDVSVGEVKLH